MTAKRENWLVFYLGGRMIGGYTLAGTFPGEQADTLQHLAYEHGCRPSDIEVRPEIMQGGKVLYIFFTLGGRFLRRCRLAEMDREKIRTEKYLLAYKHGCDAGQIRTKIQPLE